MMQPFLWELDIVQYHQMSEMVLLKPNLILKNHEHRVLHQTDL